MRGDSQWSVWASRIDLTMDSPAELVDHLRDLGARIGRATAATGPYG